MATKKSAKRGSVRSVKAAARRTRQSTRVSTLSAGSSLAARVGVERNRLFKALAVVDCCRFATATLLEIQDPEYTGTVLEAVTDLLTTSLEELEGIADECEKLSRRRT